MTLDRAFMLLLIGGAALLITLVFRLYQNPLFEVYLQNWGLC